MKILIVLLSIVYQAGAIAYPVGDLTASGICNFDFEYGECHQGIQCRKAGAGWSRTVVISGKITNYPVGNGIDIQYISLNPFETDLELHFIAKDHPDTTFPYAGFQNVMTIGLREPEKYSHFFEINGRTKRDNYVRILGDKMILGRSGTAGLGYYDQVRRDFLCDLKITK